LPAIHLLLFHRSDEYKIYFSVQTICGTLLFSFFSLSLALKANLQISVKLGPKQKIAYIAQKPTQERRINTQDPELTIPLRLSRRFRDCVPREGVASRKMPLSKNKG